MILKEDITKEIVELVIENDSFYNVKLLCPECLDMDELYTCTTCWGQGGNIEYKASRIIKALYGYKFTENYTNEISIEEIKNLINDNEITYYQCSFFYDEHPSLERFKEEDWDECIELTLYNLFFYLLD